MAEPIIIGLDVAAHPMGHRINVSWAIQYSTLPTTYRVVLFRKKGAAITAGEINAWIADGTDHTDIRVYVFDDDLVDTAPVDDETWHGPSDTRLVHDTNCERGVTYYYAIIAKDTGPGGTYTDPEYGSAAPLYSANVQMFPVRELLKLAIKQILIDLGNMVDNKDFFLVDAFTNIREHDPEIGIFRLDSIEGRRYIGDLKDAADPSDDTEGSLGGEQFAVVWQSRQQDMVEGFYHIFKAAWPALADFLRKHGAQNLSCRTGAEQIVRGVEDAPWSYRGRMTITVEHDESQISFERPHSGTSVDVTISPAGGPEAEVIISIDIIDGGWPDTVFKYADVIDGGEA